MPKPINGELTDEEVLLTQRGLYVEPLNYPLDVNKIPTNGHEYIHLVRQEHAAIFPEESKENFVAVFDEKPLHSVNYSGKHNINMWKKRVANSFSFLAIQLKSKREQLMKKFSQVQFPEVKKEKECCLFCFGTDMYKRIFEDEDVEDVDEHLPYLSIVLYIKQEEILPLLKYMSNWSIVVGMNDAVTRWIYALLACLRKPVSRRCGKFLEQFYDECLIRIKECDESEKYQLHYISSILNNYFCVKAYKVGSSLDRFQKLV